MEIYGWVTWLHSPRRIPINITVAPLPLTPQSGNAGTDTDSGKPVIYSIPHLTTDTMRQSMYLTYSTALSLSLILHIYAQTLHCAYIWRLPPGLFHRIPWAYSSLRACCRVYSAQRTLWAFPLPQSYSSLRCESFSLIFPLLVHLLHFTPFHPSFSYSYSFSLHLPPVLSISFYSLAPCSSLLYLSTNSELKISMFPPTNHITSLPLDFWIPHRFPTPFIWSSLACQQGSYESSARQKMTLLLRYVRDNK